MTAVPKRSPLSSSFKKAKALTSGNGLTARILRGGALISAGSAAEHALRFARNMILTRLLMPEALGVMAIILAINAALGSFTEVGIREAVIQHPDAENKQFLNAAWWFAFTRASLLFVIGAILTPFLTSFYSISHYSHLLLFSFVAILFNGSMSSRAFTAMKKMEYVKWVAIQEGGSICGITLTLLLVWLLGDLRALVIGYVAEAIFRCLLSFTICPFFPKLSFEKNQSQALFRFARGMAGVPLLTFIFMQADIFVLGKMISKHDIGLYGMAISLAGVPGIIISVLINPIMMPVFAQIRNEKQRLNTTLTQMTRAMSVMGLPLTAFMLVFGDIIMKVIYGQAYSGAGLAFGLLFCTSVIRTIASPIPAIYLGLGRPALNRTFTAIRTILLLAIIYPLIRIFGMNGAALACLAAMIAGWAIQAFRMRQLTELNIYVYFGSAAIGVIAAIILIVPCVLLHHLGNDWTALIAGAVMSLMAVVAGILMAYKPEILKIRSQKKPPSSGSIIEISLERGKAEAI